MMICMIIFSGMVFGEDIGSAVHDFEDEQEIGTRSLAPCPTGPYGRHLMHPRGFGIIKTVGGSTILSGDGYVCEYCNLVLISEEAAYAGYLGYYSTYSLSYRISFGGAMLILPNGTTLQDLPYNSDLQSDFSFYHGWEWLRYSNL